jgi:serine phosphatase RsbU (regulator of sigma subunit)
LPAQGLVLARAGRQARQVFMNNPVLIFCLWACGCLVPSLACGQRISGELEDALGKATGEERIRVLNRLSEEYRERDLNKAEQLAQEALQLSLKGDYAKPAIVSRINLGVVQRSRGDSKDALDNFVKAQLEAEDLNDTTLQADALHKIGVTYLFILDFEAALRFTKREEVLLRAQGDKKGLADSRNLLGLILSNQGKHKEALAVLFQSLASARESQDKNLIYKPLTNIGQVYFKLGKLDSAELFIGECIQISEETGNKFGIASGLLNLSEVYLAKKDYEQAAAQANRALLIGQGAKALPVIRNAYNNLTNIYEQAGDLAAALRSHRNYKAAEDSLLNRNSRRQKSETEARYEAAKKELEFTKLQQENEFRQLVVLSLLLVIALAAVAVALLINRNMLKQRVNRRLVATNEEVTAKSNEIARQKQLIEQINLNFTDSVVYARRIQDAIFPPEPEGLRLFSDYFIINLPRDIVSGDFYWFTELEGNPHTGQPSRLLVVLGDCTGHGVPGAFLTVMCNSLLLEITNEVPDLTAAKVLDQMHHRMVQVLRQRQDQLYDGLDLAACIYTPASGALEYAGARLPLLLRLGEAPLELVRGARSPIGDLHYDNSKRNYHSEHFQLAKGDSFYLSSDGYGDQFGGPNDQKFRARRFRELLAAAADRPMSEQRDVLLDNLRRWMGPQRQTDDILLLGLRV